MFTRTMYVSWRVNVKGASVTWPFEVDFTVPTDFHVPPIFTCDVRLAFLGTPLSRSFAGWLTDTDTVLAALTEPAAFAIAACRTPGGLDDVDTYTPPPSDFPGRMYVKALARVPVDPPRLTPIDTAPVVDDAGVRAVIVVLDATLTPTAATPPTVTVSDPVKPVP